MGGKKEIYRVVWFFHGAIQLLAWNMCRSFAPSSSQITTVG